MSKTLWFVLAALMFAGTYSVTTAPTSDDSVTAMSADAGEGSYPTPICMPGGTCK